MHMLWQQLFLLLITNTAGRLPNCADESSFSSEREQRTLGMASYLEDVARLANISQSAIAFDSNLDCMHWGMLPSEAVAVLAAARAARITHFFESGVSYGQSTEFFCRTFETWHPRVHFAGVDRDERKLLKSTTARLHQRNHTVELVRGEAKAFLTKQLRALSNDNRVGIMLDGPKGLDALQLGENLMKAYPQVAFFAIHDVSTVEFPVSVFDAITSKAALWTGDGKWRSSFGSLDIHCNAKMKSYRYPCHEARVKKGLGIAIVAGKQLHQAAMGGKGEGDDRVKRPKFTHLSPPR